MSLSALQTAIKTRLDGAAYFAGTAYTPARPISVLKDDAHDIDTEIDKAIDSFGLAVVVNQPRWIVPDDERDIANAAIEVAIEIGENVTLNRDTNNAAASLQHCQDVAYAVLRRLHGHSVLGWTRLQVTAGVPVAHESLQIYHVTVRTSQVIEPMNS